MTTPLPLLALFYARMGDSRIAELEAAARRLGAPDIDWGWDTRVLSTHGGDVGPRLVQWLPRLDEADLPWLADAAATSVGCRGVFEVWGQGDTLEACAAAAAAVPASHIRARIQGSWRAEAAVLGARKSHRAGDLGARMAAFGTVLDAIEDRPVDLKDPAHRLWLVEDRQLLKDLGPLPDPPPRHLLLLELPARATPARSWLRRLDLRRRAFLSTSTLRADRALLMCNLALARAPRTGATLLDPYCGSGGVLLAGAALGAHTVGSDLDWRMVSDNRWPLGIQPTADRPQRGQERVRMRDNFVEAELPEPRDLLTLDVAAPDAAARLLAANGGAPYDALVCDPPYGRREFQGGEDAWAGELTFKVDAAALGSTLRALLGLAGRVLGPMGRLVFLSPVRAPRDAHKPTPEALRGMLRDAGAPLGLRLRHLGVEIVHRGLHRAVVVMDRAP